MPFLDTALKAAQKVGLGRERVLLMGDERGHGLTHWADVNAEKAWIKPKRTIVDPKKDLAYLVYSSVSILWSCVRTSADEGSREPQVCRKV